MIALKWIFRNNSLLRYIIVALLSAPILSISARGIDAPLPDNSQPIPPEARKTIQSSFFSLPLTFEANQGQTATRVKFLCRASGYTFFLTGNEAVLALPPTSHPSPSLKPASHDPQSTMLHLQLLGANPNPEVSGLEELPGKSNYFIGNDPQKWRTNVPTYSRVLCREVYPGINLVYYGNGRQLEHDFVVQPGANPGAIQLGIRGLSGRLQIDSGGNLRLPTASGQVVLRKPTLYQESNSVRKEVSGSFVLLNWRSPGSYSKAQLREQPAVGFQVGTYNHHLPLIIDPVLAYSTYLGGSGYDTGQGIAVDPKGCAYITGATSSLDLPTAAPLQPSHGEAGGANDAFVFKLNSSGRGLVYSTYLGGGLNDFGAGIAVDSQGSAYITGYTDSMDFPTASPLQSISGGARDAFVCKLNPSGTSLVYSSYLGGSGNDAGYGIALDSSGSAYLAGSTSSTNFPTVNPLQSTNGGWSVLEDAFVSRISSSGAAILYSTYLGGSGNDYGWGIAVDASGSAYIAGQTSSTDFPVVNPLQPNHAADNGQDDAFVCKFSPSGTGLLYSTYLGGSNIDYARGIAVDSGGSAYITGLTWSTNFPTTRSLSEKGIFCPHAV